MPDPHDPETRQAFHILGTLHRLTVRGCRAGSLRALRFLMLNDTIEMVPYARAFLFQRSRAGWQPVAASGTGAFDRDTELGASLRTVADHLPDPLSPQPLSSESLPEGVPPVLPTRADGMPSHIAWIPVLVYGEAAGALWLERNGEEWSGSEWSGSEIQVLTRLAEGYGAAWERFVPKRASSSAGGWRRWGRRIAVLAVLAYVLFLHPFRLRITAPCEVVPADPYGVAAPETGIVEAVHVRPGQWVEPGTVLFVYDSRIPQQERLIARQQVQVTEAELKKAEGRALRDNDALSDMAILRHRLAQDRIRLELAEQRMERLVVRAPVAGEVRIDRPEAWRGTPVQTGQRILEIADPGRTEVELWIDQDDHAGLRPGTPMSVFLHAAPEVRLTGQVAYIAPLVSISPAQTPAFRAVGVWVGADGAEGTDGADESNGITGSIGISESSETSEPGGRSPAGVTMGLKGTAVLSGPETSVAYWLVRRPWISLRRYFGI